MNIVYDAPHDVLIIDGFRYSGQMFRMFHLAEPGTWLRIEVRHDDVITVFQPDDATARMFDAITGKGVGAQP